MKVTVNDIILIGLLSVDKKVEGPSPFMGLPVISRVIKTPMLLML